MQTIANRVKGAATGDTQTSSRVFPWCVPLIFFENTPNGVEWEPL